MDLGSLDSLDLRLVPLLISTIILDKIINILTFGLLFK